MSQWYQRVASSVADFDKTHEVLNKVTMWTFHIPTFKGFPGCCTYALVSKPANAHNFGQGVAVDACCGEIEKMEVFGCRAIIRLKCNGSSRARSVPFGVGIAFVKCIENLYTLKDL